MPGNVDRHNFTFPSHHYVILIILKSDSVLLGIDISSHSEVENRKMGDKSKYEMDLKLYYHKVNNEELLMPAKDFPAECLDLFKDFKLRGGDCLCATYPKMGTMRHNYLSTNIIKEE